MLIVLGFSSFLKKKAEDYSNLAEIIFITRVAELSARVVF